MSLRRFRFEVSGKVQGVFFRKYTVAEAKRLEITGWVANTDHGTVTGQAEGSKERTDKFKHWLSNVGSPKSRIEKAVFTEEAEVSSRMWADFSVHE